MYGSIVLVLFFLSCEPRCYCYSMALTNSSEIHWAPRNAAHLAVAPAKWRVPRALLQTICPVCATGQMTKRTNGTKYFPSALAQAIGNVAKVLLPTHTHTHSCPPKGKTHTHAHVHRKRVKRAQDMHNVCIEAKLWWLSPQNYPAHSRMSCAACAPAVFVLI